MINPLPSPTLWIWLVILLTPISMHSTTFLAIFGLLIGVYIITRRKSTSTLPLPPGPKPLPIIGNVHQAPKSHGWRTYREWSKQYGPIVHVNMLGQPVIILSTSEVAHDLLAKRGATFSDRPRLFVKTLFCLHFACNMS